MNKTERVCGALQSLKNGLHGKEVLKHRFYEHVQNGGIEDPYYQHTV